MTTTLLPALVRAACGGGEEGEDGDEEAGRMAVTTLRLMRREEVEEMREAVLARLQGTFGVQIAYEEEEAEAEAVVPLQEEVVSRKRKSRWDSDSEEEEKEKGKKKIEVEVTAAVQEMMVKKEETVVEEQPAKRIAMMCRELVEGVNFERVNKIDEGTYGEVFRFMDKEKNRLVALKRVKLSKNLIQEGFPITALREINVLLALRHENIVRVHEMVVKSRNTSSALEFDSEDMDDDDPRIPFHVFMVMDLWDLDLKTVMTKLMDRPFSQSETKCIMKQLLSALAFMHERWFMHRDLKTANILYNNSNGQVAICDFGLARKFSEYDENDPISDREGYTPVVITLHYRPPELLLLGSTNRRQPYSQTVDLWSLGCIMGEMLTKKTLMPGTTEIEQLNLIWDLLGTPIVEAVGRNESPPPPSRWWPSFPQVVAASKIPPFTLKPQNVNHLRDRYFPSAPIATADKTGLTDRGMDLLVKLLTLNPDSRIPAKEAEQHAWFEEFPLPRPREKMPKFALPAQ